MLGREDFGGFETGDHGAAVGDEGDVRAFAFDISDAERDDVFFVRDFPCFVIKDGVFHDVDGVVVADGGFHEALGIVGGGGADDFEARGVGDEVFGGVAVGGSDVGASVGRTADDDGTVDPAAAHVADAGGVIDDLVPGDVGKAPEHEFHDRTHAEHAGSDAHTDEAGLGDGGIDDPFVAPLFPETIGDFISPVILGNFFAHEDDIFITGQFLVEGLADGFAVSDQGHRGWGKRRIGKNGRSMVPVKVKRSTKGGPGNRNAHLSGFLCAENWKLSPFFKIHASPRSATSSSSSPR